MKIKIGSVWKLLRPVLKKFAAGLVKDLADELKADELAVAKEAKKKPK